MQEFLLSAAQHVVAFACLDLTEQSARSLPALTILVSTTELVESMAQPTIVPVRTDTRESIAKSLLALPSLA